MLSAIPAETGASIARTSKRAAAGASSRTGIYVAMATPAVEQNGQKCPLVLLALRSAQKWNCAARNTSASKIAQVLILPMLDMLIAIVGRNSQLMSTTM